MDEHGVIPEAPKVETRPHDLMNIAAAIGETLMWCRKCAGTRGIGWDTKLVIKFRLAKGKYVRKDQT